MLSAPSGTGKTTLVKELLKKDRSLSKTISHTTRAPRPRERRGKDYHFVDPKTFQKMIAKKDFIEWAKVYGEKYGTSHRTVRQILGKGKDVILVIEAKGARAIRGLYKNSVFILVLPPTRRELRNRIFKRLGTTAQNIRTRLESACQEVQKMHWYDYVVVNDRLPQAVTDLQAIIKAERRAMGRQGKIIRKFSE